jgi:hypothetical protein
VRSAGPSDTIGGDLLRRAGLTTCACALVVAGGRNRLDESYERTADGFAAALMP